MIEGLYNIRMKTPFGEQKGEITFKQNQDKLIGTFELMGNRNSFEGTTDGKNFMFNGETKSPIGKMRIHN